MMTQQTAEQAAEMQELQESVRDLRTLLGQKEEELHKLRRLFAQEQQKVTVLEKTVKEKDLIISQLSHQQSSASGDLSSMPQRMPDTVLKQK